MILWWDVHNQQKITNLPHHCKVPLRFEAINRQLSKILRLTPERALSLSRGPLTRASETLPTHNIFDGFLA